MKRISTIVVVVVALALGATTYAAVLRTSAGHKVKPRPAIAVTAQVSGLLYPGSIRPLKLRVRNLTSHTLRALAVTVKVGTPTHGCPAWAVIGGHFALRLTLPRRVTRTVWTSLRMMPSSPDSCQGARIPLRFTLTLAGHP